MMGIMENRIRRNGEKRQIKIIKEKKKSGESEKGEKEEHDYNEIEMVIKI